MQNISVFVAKSLKLKTNLFKKVFNLKFNFNFNLIDGVLLLFLTA